MEYIHKKTFVRLAGILLGNFMYAVAVTVFIVPNNLITGGTTGLALFFNQIAGIPISLFVSGFNITMFILGAWILGKQFALTTAASTIMYPLMLGILEKTGYAGIVVEEKLVAILYAGILIGAGIGLVMRCGASTGGMDIPALILKKWKNYNISMVIYLCDCIILLLQMTHSDSTSVLYGILLILVYTIVLDKVLLLGNVKIQIKIVSKKYEEINKMLGDEMDCGTSLLHMKTGFLYQEQEMVLAILSNRDLPKVNMRIMEIDPEAFITIHQVNEVRGRGFTLNKVHKGRNE